MKKVLGLMFVVFGIFVLVGCGQKDMSGTYYFNRSADADFPNVGQLALIKASDDGMKYKATEAVPANMPSSKGTLTINDKSYLDLKLSEKSEDIYPNDLGLLDISNIKNEKYEFKNGVLKIGDVEFYSDQTKEGKELKVEWDKGPKRD